MKLNRGLSVWQKPKDFSPILSFLWKGQKIDKTVTIPNKIEPNREKSVIWNWVMFVQYVHGYSICVPRYWSRLFEKVRHFPKVVFLYSGKFIKANSSEGSLELKCKGFLFRKVLIGEVNFWMQNTFEKKVVRTKNLIFLSKETTFQIKQKKKGGKPNVEMTFQSNDPYDQLPLGITTIRNINISDQ